MCGAWPSTYRVCACMRVCGDQGVLVRARDRACVRPCVRPCACVRAWDCLEQKAVRCVAPCGVVALWRAQHNVGRPGGRRRTWRTCLRSSASRCRSSVPPAPPAIQASSCCRPATMARALLVQQHSGRSSSWLNTCGWGGGEEGPAAKAHTGLPRAIGFVGWALGLLNVSQVGAAGTLQNIIPRHGTDITLHGRSCGSPSTPAHPSAPSPHIPAPCDWFLSCPCAQPTGQRPKPPPPAAPQGPHLQHLTWLSTKRRTCSSKHGWWWWGKGCKG